MFIHDAVRWLRAERIVPECPANQRSLAAQYVAAAELRRRAARDASRSSVLPAVLLREATILLARAAMVARGEGMGFDPVDALATLRAAATSAPSDDVTRSAEEAIGSHDPLYFDRMDEESLARACAALESEVAWLRTQVDLRSPAYVRGTRIGRHAAAAVLALWLLHAAFVAIFPPHNLALHKPVTASSHQPGTPDPSGLVDGIVADTYGLHTSIAAHDPWAIIDLQQIAKISKIVVYNRSDQNLSDGLPYALDLSTDGVTYHEVARRDVQFGDGSFMSAPWTVKLSDHGRYVRIRAKGYMALNEVEVF